MSATDLVCQGRTIVEALGGKWQSRQGLCCCPAHDDRTPSLSVRVGDTALLFTCFAGCDTRDVIAGLRRRGLFGGGVAVSSVPQPRPNQRHYDPAFLLKLWNAAAPIAGTVAERYLAARAIRTNCPELRFAAAARIGRGAGAYVGPALVAAVRDDQGLRALQRTFLNPDGNGKAKIATPRRMLGEPGCGAVRLSRPDRILGLAEGLENAISAQAILRIPVWASLGTRRLPHIAIPPQVEELVLLADPDRAGREAAASSRQTLARPGLEIRYIWPPANVGDWNDVACARREEGAGTI